VKTQVKKLDGTKRELHVEVEGDVITNKFEDVFKKIGQEAKVPGFRPGHAPRDVLEKHYSAQARQQALKELIPEVYNQAIEKEGLDVIDLPDIYDVKFEGKSLIFKAAVEVAPEIKLINYKGMRVEYKKIEAAPDEVKRQIDSLRESHKAQNTDESFARSLGYPAVSDLERAVERQILLQKENLQRQNIEATLIETLSKAADFKLPESLVKRQLEDLLRRTKLDLALKGVERAKIDEKESELAKELEPQARAQVKTYLILAEIARKEKIAVDDQMPARAMELLLREADWQEAK